jgi:hypothetical protein
MTEQRSTTRREFLLRAPRGAMEFVRCRSMDEAARIGAEKWTTTPFTVYDLSTAEQRDFRAETETIVKGVVSA